MSKSILVIDTPDNCCYCPCAGTSMVCQATNREVSGGRPEWCPLQELPERKSEEFGQTIINAARAEGWNACLDAIEGGAEYE